MEGLSVFIEYVGQHQTGSVEGSASCFDIHCSEDFTSENVRSWPEHSDGYPDPLTRYTPLLSYWAVCGDIRFREAETYDG